MPNRRHFLRRTSAALGAALVAPQTSALAQTSVLPQTSVRAEPHFACNQYTWTVYFRREGRDFSDDLDANLAEVAASGLDGFEPNATSPEEIDRMAPLLEKHGLAMRSVYVNSTLHKEDEAEASIADVLAIAERAKQAGTEIIVTNPSPIQWGGAENKTDAELRVQAAALDRLGAALADRGLTLAYHMHDPEFRAGAREFHHMLVGTDPAHVTFCCDAHWAYRGAGNSEVALFDILKLYGDRITELHVRQSDGGTWTEVLGPGDIDYEAFVAKLVEMDVRPLVVLEQAVEEGTPHTMDALAAHRQSLDYLREVFTPLFAS